ncbi:conserved hypothetical protein [delta proteobacterium NaphS2]|nr:conserved hypothetical protein [delta proteobacterium NaphS2]
MGGAQFATISAFIQVELKLEGFEGDIHEVTIYFAKIVH